MRPRPDGFYRVIYKGQWVIAEYEFRGRTCGTFGDEISPWCLPGVEGWMPTSALSAIGEMVQKGEEK